MFKRGLAFDLARRSGWALSREGAQPTSGSKLIVPETFEMIRRQGEFFVRQRAWMNEMIAALRPHYIAWEAPNRFKKRSMTTERLLLGMCIIAEHVAAENGLDAIEESVTTVRSVVVGDPKLGKIGAQDYCRSRGWDFVDDNAADALVLLEYVDSSENPRHLGPRLGAMF